MSVSESDVTTALRDLRLAGQAVCLHSSLRSFGWMDGGLAAVVRGFLWAGCTLLVPTFTSQFAVPPPSEDEHLPRNAWPEGWTSDHDDLEGFSPASECVDPDMGAIPATVARWPGRVRGFHPLDSFSAWALSLTSLVIEDGDLDVPVSGTAGTFYCDLPDAVGC